MASSKVWRAGRWAWECRVESSGMSFQDHWACGGRSRLTYTTLEEAEKSADRHEHNAVTFQIQPKFKFRSRRKKK
jgi:hypothetical protein